MEYVAGKTIGSIIFDDMAKAEQYMSLSVDVQLKIHDIKANNFELMTEKLNRKLLSASILSEKQKNVLIEKLYKMECEKRLCHGDYHVFNLILNETGVTIIDWVDSSTGDRKADIYRTYLLYSQYSMELANLYLRIYCEKSGLFQEDIFAWESIIAGARLSENVASEKANRLLEIVARYWPK
jgi:thiamine kinase-like enzyme